MSSYILAKLLNLSIKDDGSDDAPACLVWSQDPNRGTLFSQCIRGVNNTDNSLLIIGRTLFVVVRVNNKIFDIVCVLSFSANDLFSRGYLILIIRRSKYRGTLLSL